MKPLRLKPPAFRRGFSAILPLWLGAGPLAVAYTIAAQKAGLNAVDIQFMSLTVFSGAAQLSLVQLLSTGVPAFTLLATSVAMSLHHALYGLTLTKRLDLSLPERVTAAYLLTDGAYGMAIAADTNLTFSFLFGAECSMFLAWNVFTALGLLLGHLGTGPLAAHLDFVAPLTFFILLVLAAKTRIDLGVAIVSALMAWGCMLMQLGSATVLVVGIGGAFTGALLMESQRRKQKRASRSAQP